MKTANIQRVIGALLVAAIMVSGCSKDNTLDEIIRTGQDNTETNPIAQALGAIDGVRNVQIKTNKAGKDTIYFFSFRQLVNHDNPDEGTFDQQVALTFKGFDRDVVLYTNGYTMPQKVEEMFIASVSMYLDANQVNVEHRYFGQSQPQPTDKLAYTYFNAKQQSQDLHAIVQALKKGLFKTNRWVSTGVSKDGITSALYAYYSDQYGWQDINVFMPFCAPFLTGGQRDGKFTCMDSSIGEYMEQVCGSGYPEGSAEAIACQRLRDIAQYICTNQRVRDACNKYVRENSHSDYLSILKQYNQNSPMSTGNLEKDVTALSCFMYYYSQFTKFSYVQFSNWAKYVPDPLKALTDDEELEKLCSFVFMGDQTKFIDYLEEQGEQTRSTATDDNQRYWNYLLLLRDDDGTPYGLQAFTELGYPDYAYNNVDGSFLTKEQVANVNELFSMQTLFGGLYPQDEGRLMRGFHQWVGTETTQNIIFVYARNDPWTAGRPDDEAVRQNPKTEMIIDPIAVHNDYFLGSMYFTTDSKNAIIAALEKYLR